MKIIIYYIQIALKSKKTNYTNADEITYGDLHDYLALKITVLLTFPVFS